MSETTSRRHRLRPLVVGTLVGALIYGALGFAGAGLPVAAADDSSARTVTARGYDPAVAEAPFPDLSVTVSQTTELVKQGIQVSWSGAAQSERRSSNSAGRNFLQIAQCWGEDPNWPGHPDRTTCQMGSFPQNGQSRDTTLEGVKPEDAEYSAPGAFPGYVDVSIPFRASTGEVVQRIADGKVTPGIDPGNNEFFGSLSTNEIVWAGSAADGSGTAKFEIQTAQQSPGLGCGRVAEGSSSPQSCWIVIVPRGESDEGESAINRSPLLWENWKHHLAVKLDFKPSGARCPLGAAERTVAGSELAAGAMSSWQPVLCGTGGSIYSTLVLPEEDAAAQAATSPTGMLAFTSRAYDPGEGYRDPLVYAPIALAGVSIAFAVDSYTGANEAPESVRARDGQALTDLKLTPRLVVKLLTNTYTDSMPRGARENIEGNPRNLTQDQDFLAINDDVWRYQALNGVGLSDLQVPQGRSDLADAVWKYVLSDPEAVDFLAGKPDPWGTKVNPWASTDARINPAGVGLTLPRLDFPRPDPSEDTTWSSPQNAVGHRPYTNDFDRSAYLILRGDAQEMVWDQGSVPPRYRAAGRALVGDQQVLGLTDTVAGAKYQVVEASLRNPAGSFVAPSRDSLGAAAAAMTSAASQPQVFGFDFASDTARGAKNAYPLAMPVYAAANPALDDAAARADYAALIRFAVGTGQVPGTADGQLPSGYAPLSEGWRTQALAAADAIERGPVDPTPSPSPSPSGPSAPGPGAPTGGTTPVSSSATSSFAPPAAPVAATDPVAQGSAAAALSGGTTPDDPEMGLVGAAVPLSLLGGAAAAALTPMVPLLRRRV